MVEVTLIGALIAGLLSFLSPCVLPLVPAYLSYISGVSVNELRQHEGGRAASARRRALMQSVWFIAGFSLVFIALGISATLLGQWLLAHMNVLGKIAGTIIVIFGLHYTGLIRIPLLMMDTRFEARGINARHGIGALILGAAFAFGWTPCVGPILGAILAVASIQADLSHGILLLFAYSLGLAIPFLLAALVTDSFLRWSQRFKRYLTVVEKVSGVLLIMVGVLIFIGSFSILSGWLAQWFPALANLDGAFTLPGH